MSNGSEYTAPWAGVAKLLIGLMSAWTGANSCFTIAARSIENASDLRTASDVNGSFSVFIQTASYERLVIESNLIPGMVFSCSWPGWACGYSIDTWPERSAPWAATVSEMSLKVMLLRFGTLPQYFGFGT